MASISFPGRADAISKLVNLSREDVRAKMQIPSEFLLRRGFSADVLDAFDVGRVKGFDREVVPLYDETGDRCVGCTFMSNKPACRKCKRHHEMWSDCKYGEGRWGFNKGFRKQSYLYNLAATRSSTSPLICVVEGLPDVWRMTEAGFVAVALLGCYATDEQIRHLSSFGKPIYVILNNSQAAEKGWDRMRRKIERPETDMHCGRIQLPDRYKDVAEVEAEALRKLIQKHLLTPEQSNSSRA